MKPKIKEKQINDFENIKQERDNKRICIIACIILACASLLMYKNTSRTVWGIILVASVCAGLYLLTKLAELDGLIEEYSEAEQENYEENTKEEIEYEEDNERYYNDDIQNYDEESRRHFNTNMPLFKKEAKEKYSNLIKEMGMTPDCVGNGVMDVWSNVDGIFGINKWEFFDKEISKFGGRYTDMIIQGNSGRCVDFCELRIPINDLEKLGLSQYTVDEMVDFYDNLKQKLEDDIKGRNMHRRSTDKQTTDEQLSEIVKMINDLINENNNK